MKDLAPQVYRQRLIIEGKPSFNITSEHIKKYLGALSEKLDMKLLIDPVTHYSNKFGWAGWIHWETSGTHFYAWDAPSPFFSVDIYTCKKFDVDIAVRYTHDFFQATELEYQGI